MALESERVTADIVEVTDFPELIQRYLIRGVPKTVINEGASVEGAMPEEALIVRVLEAAGIKLDGRENGDEEGV